MKNNRWELRISPEKRKAGDIPMKINGFLILCLVALTVIGVCCQASSFENGGYKYYKNSRQPVADKDLPEEASNKGVDAAMTVLNAFPGFSVLAPPISYLVLVAKLTVDENKSSEEGGGVGVSGGSKFVETMVLAGSVIANMMSPTSMESSSAIAMQIVSGANLYCKQQKIYQEETNYLSKTNTTSDGGYPIFPIYPLKIPVKNGQCDISSTLETAFVEGIDLFLGSKDTKCSFSFSATNTTCSNINLAIFISYLSSVMAAESVCIFSSPDKSKSTSKLQTAAEVIAKIVNISVLAVQTAASLFFDSKLALDPIVFATALKIEIAFDLLLNLAIDLASQNYACVAARIAAAMAVDLGFKLGIAITAFVQAKKAKKALNKYDFCGHDWLSYKETEDGKYWVRGGYEHSHYRYVVDQIESPNGVEKNIKNQIFREYIYGGREHISFSDTRGNMPEDGFTENDNRKKARDYDINYCIDPRTTEEKGFAGILQRYYMRGREKANFACNRFIYDGISNCYLPKSIVDGEEQTNCIKDETGKGTYCLVSSDKYSKACQKAFAEARKCCRHRSKHLICLHDRASQGTSDGVFCFANVLISGYDEKNLNSNLFQYIKNRNDDLDKATCKLGDPEIEFEASKKKGTDYVCVFSHNLCPYDFKLNAGLNYRASYCDSDYFTDYREPAGVLQRAATHFNKADCTEGLFSVKFREKYKEQFSNTGRSLAAFTYDKVRNDMMGFNANDFETIYDFDSKPFHEGAEDYLSKRLYGFSLSAEYGGTQKVKLHNLTVEEVNYQKSSAFGKVKNFCQYRAHCVEVEREEDYGDDYAVASLFLDSSCNGTTNNSRNILQDNGGGVPRQFSAPVTECIFESLKNLISGVSGNSLCKLAEDLNSLGFCGLDNEEEVKKHIALGDNTFFEDKYKKINDVFIIKNQKLPENYNPFLKIQRYFISIVRAALTVFMVLYFYKQLLMGNLESMVKPENIMKMISSLFKFSIVIWLIFYNGWQDGVYNYVVNFATAGYSFVNGLMTKSMRNPKNHMLGDSGTVRISRRSIISDETDGKNVLLCFKYDMFNNIYYSARDVITNRCEKGFYSNYEINTPFEEATKIFIRKDNPKNHRYARQTGKNIVIANNQEIAQLVYFIDGYNKKHSDRLSLEITEGSLWNKDYDGCYFDVTEYDDSKSYLALFDTLDCKLIRYLGYSTNNMAPNILLYSAIMLVPNYFFPDGFVSSLISGLGSFLFGLMMSFMFLVFNVIIKAIYTFTAAFFTLSILIFISPIILPLMFFERTKSIFNSWLENIMESIFKPIMNFAFTMMYINIIDIVLLKNLVFSKHSIRGRGAIVECPDNSSSFLCLIGGIPIVGQIKILFTSGLKNVFLDVLIVALFFLLFDKILEDLEQISGQIFKGLSGSDSGGGFSMNSNAGKIGGVESVAGQAFGSAIGAGKQLEEFRSTYVNNAPGALVDKMKRSAGEMRQSAKQASAEEAKETKEAKKAGEDKEGEETEETKKAKSNKPGRLGRATAAMTNAAANILESPAKLAEKIENARDKLGTKVERYKRDLSRSVKRKVKPVVKTVKDLWEKVFSEKKKKKKKKKSKKK